MNVADSGTVLLFLLPLFSTACFPDFPGVSGDSAERSSPGDTDEADDPTGEEQPEDTAPKDRGDSGHQPWDTNTCIGFTDADGDGFGGSEGQLVPCDDLPLGVVDNDDDCDDTNDAVHPDGVEACNGLDDDCDGTADSEAVCGCPVHPREGRPYLFCADNANWEKAVEACRSLDSYDLVVIGSEQEQAFVFDAASRVDHGDWWWIGFHDRNAGPELEPDAGWEWVDGSAVLYTNWATEAGQPDNADGDEDCAHLYDGSGLWNDLPCGTTAYHGTQMHFICETTR